ncbi:MAG TPA: hypothetical protein VKO87_00975 [Gemmatimonadaceae bacterium]|nr:hypothetical protein [Gemmatimonadaceae bacterium]
MKSEWKLVPTVVSGTLWGLVWGLVFLAPGIIRTHNMAGTPAEAVRMIAVMAAIFAFLGAGIAAGLFVIAWIVRRVAPAPWLRVAPAHSITTAVLLPAIYIALGAIGPVVDRYLEFVDKGIATLIASFPERPNVLIVSDHGQAAREDGVPFKGWHASPGIFLASGPDIVPRSRTLDVSYFDIVPTILDLKGLEKPAQLRGRALLAKK